MHKNWTNEEVEYLKENFGDMRNEDIAKSLNRTVQSIKYKSYQLKLKKKDGSFRNKKS